MKKFAKPLVALLLVIASLSLSACTVTTTVTYDLKDFDSFKDNFIYAYSPECQIFGEFKQDDNGLVSYRNENHSVDPDIELPDYFPNDPNEFAYISLLTKKKYTAGTVVTLHCSFEELGAPLIVFSDEINEGEHNIYGLHFDVVAYNGGCNIWEIKPSETEKWNIDPTRLGGMDFQIENNAPIEIIVEFGEKQITVTMNGNSTVTDVENMPESFHVGFTANEGVDHFYDFTIETTK